MSNEEVDIISTQEDTELCALGIRGRLERKNYRALLTTVLWDIALTSLFLLVIAVM